MAINYSSPVNKLLTYGECKFHEWPNYMDIGLTKEHISELIQMATDDELNWADSDSLEVWAPVHAWRALGQLKAEEAIEPLMNLFHELKDSDWAGEELPQVYGMIGPKAIPSLAHYLANDYHDVFSRIHAAHSLEIIGNKYPEARKQCIAVLTEQLENFDKNDSVLNGFLISHLVDLKATESISTIQKAYEKKCVDLSAIGDFEDVEILFGLREKRSSPRPELYPEYSSLVKAIKAIGNVGKDKISRNAPCPCGSGKKYKKCCGK